MRIIFAGTTENAADVLRYLVEVANHEVVAVLTREDAPVGRKQQLTASPVAILADSIGLPVIRANRVTEQVNERIAQFRPDLGLIVAYGALLKSDTLGIPEKGWVNIHYSLLPKLRGAAPVQHALIRGDAETGVSIFQLNEGMDAGPMLAQIATQIEPNENAGDLLNRLTSLSITMLDECLARIASGLAQFDDQVGEVSFAPKLSRSAAKINFQDDAKQIEDLVRGCNPEPMAWAEYEGLPIRILRARRVESTIAALGDTACGTVAAIDKRVFVTAGSASCIELLEVQPASKRAMPAIDWHRGTSRDVVLS